MESMGVDTGFENPTGDQSHSLHPNRCGDFSFNTSCIPLNVGIKCEKRSWTVTRLEKGGDYFRHNMGTTNSNVDCQ